MIPSSTNPTIKLKLPSPAKLNLMLHITGRLDSGYHSLQTLFQILDFSDQIVLEQTDDSDLYLETIFEGVAPQDNLIIKAATLLQKITNCNKGARISINKCLPMGGGLGGGSSNAATVLVGLNQLWNTRLTLPELANIGLQLGADVPVFIHGHSAWAEGVGEQLTAVDLPECWYLVIFPNVHVNTGEIFSHPQLTRNTPIMTIRSALETGGHNDCEEIVRKLYPEVNAAMGWLDQFATARLTGTGSCLFASFTDEQVARDLLAKLPHGNSGFVARALNRSPLHDNLFN